MLKASNKSRLESQFQRGLGSDHAKGGTMRGVYRFHWKRGPGQAARHAQGTRGYHTLISPVSTLKQDPYGDS